MSEDLVEALLGQLEMTRTAFLQAFVGHALVMTPLGHTGEIETQSCLLHLTI